MQMRQSTVNLYKLIMSCCFQSVKIYWLLEKKVCFNRTIKAEFTGKTQSNRL